MQLRPDQFKIRCLGLFGPLLQLVRHWRRQGNAIGQHGQLIGRLTQNSGKNVFCVLHDVLRTNDIGGDKVITRLRFVGIRDGRLAHLEATRGRSELLADRALLRLKRRQRILRGKHIEISLANSEHQILISDLQLNFRAGDHKLGLLVGLPGGPVKNRLRQGQCPGTV